MHYLKISEILLLLNMLLLNSISFFLNAPINYLLIMNLFCIYILGLIWLGPNIYSKWKVRIILLGFVLYLYTGSDIIINHKEPILGLAYIMVGMSSGFILSKLHVGTKNTIGHP